MALLVAGCGGAPQGDAGLPVLSAPGPAAAGAVVAPAVVADGAAPAALVSDAAGYSLVLMNERAVHQDLDQLDPRQGKGYSPLHAFIYVKGRPRSGSPVASVKPVCVTPTRCEYLPPRKAGVAERFVISVDDESVVQLSTDSDMVVITPRQLAYARPVTVHVTLTIPGQQPLVKRILYGGKQA